MPKCVGIFPHKLKLESLGMIHCERCKRKWNPREGGREVLPIGYTSWLAWHNEWMNKSGVPAYAPQSYMSGDDSTRLSDKEMQKVLAKR